ncbi:MAG TPA: CarD family transcriptional regulator [Spirochaetaceae bacterium]|nr:CarD family transcriptional regulator [Spirochaetaceae bacterium]HAW86165.1 CarD family transcriptional regulator [Spirochaetaceae bacterium]HAX38468.1 CarD family transcriptional regulator [Spirochaetaceae bacterium]HBO40169.1 CarD family transcriptional regulator [Spirochaetaceae bacterium]HCQ87199.1 CarD family transcriptional regulator [Spirochaetaceae bacterium]
MSTTSAPRYKVDQRIVYPSQGVGRITEICERSFKGVPTLYYIIYLEFPDMTVMVQSDKADEHGIRPIVPRAEAEHALCFIAEEYAPIPTDWKLRYQMNLDLLKKGSVMDIASVVRSLYHRSKVKELPILERKLYDSALNLLQDEISFALESPKDEIAELIRSKLEIKAATVPLLADDLEDLIEDEIEEEIED